MKALLVVDMLDDFVTGPIANPRSEHIIEPIRDLHAYARENPEEWIVVYGNDAHLPNDVELKVWGAHAMAGSSGANVIETLKPQDGDFVLSKRGYSAFWETGLAPLLRQEHVNEIFLTGQHTSICVRHTTADAFFEGFGVTIVEDSVEDLDEDLHRSGIEYLLRVYAVNAVYAKEVTS